MGAPVLPSPPRPTPSPLRTWLQLFRAPNLFTVPGDPLAGYLLANSWQADVTLGLAITASLCFYAAGLLMNDLADEEEDRRDRPSRPLPSHAITRRSVWIAMAFLCAAGLGALALTGHPPALYAGAGLVVLMASYNWLTKSWPIIGALNMGACRSASVMLGALVGPQAAWPIGLSAAALFGAYIAVVTNLARHETRARAPLSVRLLPVLVACAAALFGSRFALDAPDKMPAIALYALAAAAVLWLAVQMFAKPSPLPPLIGAHIRALLLFQAATCYVADPWGLGPRAAIALVCFWPLSRWVSRWFYAS